MTRGNGPRRPPHITIQRSEDGLAIWCALGERVIAFAPVAAIFGTHKVGTIIGNGLFRELSAEGRAEIVRLMDGQKLGDVGF